MKLIHGDCLEVLKTLPSDSVDAIVTDPPYGLAFMGKKWDYDVPSVETWLECLRVLKPGGHALIACGTRTQHRMAVNIEDAGFEIRDVITWLYGSGFPKSMDISKAIDKQAGAEREIIGHQNYSAPDIRGNSYDQAHVTNRERLGVTITAPTTDAAKQWQGWGTALKPSCEFWTLARKPLAEKTVAANVLKHGTGGINVGGCKIGNDTIRHSQDRKSLQKFKEQDGRAHKKVENPLPTFHQGRWPANLILSHHPDCEQSPHVFPDGTKQNQCHEECAIRMLDDQSGTPKIGASRFFYVAKASKSERNSGFDCFQEHKMDVGDSRPSGGSWERRGRAPTIRKNTHPTVKPIKLMTYLCRLITPPNGTVLDPFMGSGSTGVAAIKEGFQFIGIEKEHEYLKIAQARIGACE